MKENFITDIKVYLITVGAVSISFTDIEQVLRILALISAAGYGFWNWRVQYLKNKEERKRDD